LVTESTPFGLYDLNLAVELLKKLNIPSFVVINKFQKDNHSIEKYCLEQNIKIIGKIPFDIKIAEQYSNGNTLLDIPAVKKEFEKIFDNIIKIS
jgi:MinD superfamily P-loop ATPase